MRAPAYPRRLTSPAGGIAGLLPVLKSYVPLLGFLVMVAAMGWVGISAARPFFIVGCFGVAVLAYRTGGLGLHVAVSIALFALGPLLRRIIDLHLGYDVGATVLVGPLLALVAVFPELRALVSSRVRSMAQLVPVLLITLCTTYGWSISAFQGSLLQATIAAAKAMIPMLYCVVLMLRPEESQNVLRSAARMFLVLCPLIGFYGIAQYLSPQPWDVYWVFSSKLVAVGLPEPQMIRVFSTMNSPASFAFYATCGLLLFSFTKTFLPPLLVPPLALLPLSIALLLSSVRSAWISVVVSLVFCLLFNRTRARAGMLTVGLGFVVAFALLYTSFADTVGTRLSTLSGSVDKDGSGSERLHDYKYVLTEGERFLFGTGLGQGDRYLVTLDGQLLTSMVQMGYVIGTLYTLLTLWAGAQALLGLRRQNDMLRLVAGSIIIGQMSVFLLLDFSVGEIGFLYWMLVGILTPLRVRARNNRTAMDAHIRRTTVPVARFSQARDHPGVAET